MRSLNLNSSINALNCLGNDRFCSVIRYALELMRSCFTPQLRQRALFQAWQIKAAFGVQPVAVPVGHVVAGRPAVATSFTTNGVTPTTG